MSKIKIFTIIKTMKIAFLPIDNRPVCYTLPKLIAGIDNDIEFSMPDRKFLGDLTKQADIKELFKWLKNLPPQDAIIMSLDTLIYGGLIPSRRCPESFEQLKSRVDILKEILTRQNAKIYACSSIMRISNNNYNIEEKEYWSDWGEKIFKYSCEFDKNGQAQTDVPPEILKDYLNTRERNFKINLEFLKLQKERLIEFLVFSKDDCSPYGLNAIEARKLQKSGAFVKTGADEIPLSLLSRSINKKLKIYPIFLEGNSKDLVSNYEDISVENSVKGQIELAGCEVYEHDDADILLYINNFKNNQGEIVMKRDTKPFDGKFSAPDRPYMIADVRFANGADNYFVKKFLKNKIDDKNFYGYSAWNTTANTLGSLICGAKIKYFAAKNYNKENFLKLTVTRFLDDWAYQANIRQMLKEPDTEKLTSLMKDYENVMKNALGWETGVKYSYPWNRLFEVEIWI